MNIQGDFFFLFQNSNKPFILGVRFAIFINEKKAILVLRIQQMEPGWNVTVRVVLDMPNLSAFWGKARCRIIEIGSSKVVPRQERYWKQGCRILVVALGALCMIPLLPHLVPLLIGMKMGGLVLGIWMALRLIGSILMLLVVLLSMVNLLPSSLPL